MWIGHVLPDVRNNVSLLDEAHYCPTVYCTKELDAGCRASEHKKQLFILVKWI